MSPEITNPMDPSRWNACIKLFCRPLEALDSVQRPAALAFHYDGRVQNGGHSSHWDSPNATDDELIRALRSIGAHEQARVLAEARILRSEATEADEADRDSISELIESLDRRYYQLSPGIPEVLARYIEAHQAHFPNATTA